jgi:4-hydroxy-2-oxoheptanedioate aldolase
MRDNPLRQRWADGEAALGAWLSIANSFSAELVARSDFDYVCVDTQHGQIDYSSLPSMLQAVNLGSATPVVRVPWNEPGIIGKCLDAGARAIIIPMVNTREQAEAAVSACRYAPVGSRSFGPTRVSRQEGSDYYANANADTAVIPMIETQEALGNLDDILSVPGIDAIYVGPADLSISLGIKPGNNDGDPIFDRAYAEILAGCERHGVVPGCHTVAALGARRVEQGFQMVTIFNDVLGLSQSAAANLAEVRGATAEADSSVY